MSRNAILLRVLGTIDHIDDLVRAIDLPARVSRHGTISLVNEIQPMNVVLVELGTLYISIIQQEEQGGLELPASLIAAAAAMG
jgi:hypothetical protein